MTRARSALVDPATTPYYHCIGRCIRRAFLCGFDAVTGRDYGHRRQWFLDRLASLTRIFCIEVCAYAIMSNHYHLVLRLNAGKAKRLSDGDVLRRWQNLHHLPMLVQRIQKGEAVSGAETRRARELIQTRRERLANLSWFMREFNEHLSRLANAEDRCTGRFWEGRFKSQALLDEQALFSCMVYVDLNPIRAGMAETPETSDYTSIQQRIQGVHRASKLRLAEFVQRGAAAPDSGLPMDWPAYLELVDWTGRAIVPGKRGAIPSTLPKALQRLEICPDAFLRQMQRTGFGTSDMVGSADGMREAARQSGRRHVHGIRKAEQLFGTGKDPRDEI